MALSDKQLDEIERRFNAPPFTEFEFEKELGALLAEVRELKAILASVAEASPERTVVGHVDGMVHVAFDRARWAAFDPNTARALAVQIIQHAEAIDPKLMAGPAPGARLILPAGSGKEN